MNNDLVMDGRHLMNADEWRDAPRVVETLALVDGRHWLSDVADYLSAVSCMGRAEPSIARRAEQLADGVFRCELPRSIQNLPRLTPPHGPSDPFLDSLIREKLLQTLPPVEDEDFS